MTPKEEFAILLEKQKIVKGDVIFVLQGDGVFRAASAVELFQDGYAPLVAIVGSANDRSYGSYPSIEVRDEMLRLGLPKEIIHFEEVGVHTHAEAKRAMELAEEKDWKTILIATSPHHQYRAFLTFLKAMRDASLDLNLVNAPANLSMTEKTPWGRRTDLLVQEFAKIIEYQKKGDVASYEDGIAHLKLL